MLLLAILVSAANFSLVFQYPVFGDENFWVTTFTSHTVIHPITAIQQKNDEKMKNDMIEQ